MPSWPALVTSTAAPPVTPTPLMPAMKVALCGGLGPNANRAGLRRNAGVAEVDVVVAGGVTVEGFKSNRGIVAACGVFEERFHSECAIKVAARIMVQRSGPESKVCLGGCLPRVGEHQGDEGKAKAQG